MTDPAERLRRLIRAYGPIDIAQYMALCNAASEFAYYRTAQPLGLEGDFVTAPEISQCFGEVIAAALAVHWHEVGEPADMRIVELGPGRGTLLADTLRVWDRFAPPLARVPIHLVEISPALRLEQERKLAGRPATWHAAFQDVPENGPIVLIANEFLDALPIRQFARDDGGNWLERCVGLDADGRFVAMLRPGYLPPWVVEEEQRTTLEFSPAREGVVHEIASRITATGGIALLIDYGAYGLSGFSLQAVRGHGRVDPLAEPAAADLSSHVDFAALAAVASRAGAQFWGPVPQGVFLKRLGIEARRDKLLERAEPSRKASLHDGVSRLIAGDRMGELFKAAAITREAIPLPPGFEDRDAR